MRKFLVGLTASAVFLIACIAFATCLAPRPRAPKATCTIGQAPETMRF